MAAPLRTINLADAFDRIAEPWSPRIAAELNGQHVKLAKLEGPFVWHRHEEADELFLVVEGRLVIELRDGAVTLEAGEFVVVPRGVEHRPVAEETAHVLLFEPAGTLNTGDVENERTVRTLDRI
jgi:mannose-6-phosphate isomerase-like protein (cupin superfamily)